MNNIIKYFAISLAVVLFAACEYEEYKYDYEYSVAYFFNQESTRSFVVTEDNDIKVGVVMGGKRYSNSNETVDYILDEQLLEGTGYALLPQKYYTLSNASQFEINEGDFQGDITITIDEAFYVDTLALGANYALPFSLTATSLDSILEGKETLLLSLKYEAELFGNYYHNGVTLEKDAQGNVINTIAYHQEEPVTKAENNWALTTVGPYSLSTSGISKMVSGDGGETYAFNIEIDGDYAVTISPNAASGIAVAQDGTCSYNKEKREFYLKYSYPSQSGNECFATDTLIFRNRILDGVSQWQ